MTTTNEWTRPGAPTGQAAPFQEVGATRGATAVRWLRGCGLMFRFEWVGVRQWVALILLVQIMMGVGMAVMYGFFYPEISRQTALFITTGVPTLALVPLGFVLIPAAVGQQRMAGTFDYNWSLPVHRSAMLTATFALNTLLALPGTALALLVGSWRYGVTLELNGLLLPAVLLSAVMAVSVGYAMALLVANPLVTNLISNALVFLVLLFTPIVYPAANLPTWLLRVHEVLPFYPMARAIRAGLTDGVVTDVGSAFAVLGAWAVAGIVLTGYAVNRRR